jgi:hypothetical protein
MPISQFDPPGHTTDLLPAHRALWSQWISDAIDGAIAGDPAQNDGPRHQFFNPLKSPPAADSAEKDVQWTAFPRLVQLGAPSEKQRWQRADASRDRQDEYCEWSVERNPQSNKIVRVTFTSEGPEYWQSLAAWQPDTVLELYQRHVSPRVRKDDVFSGGRYDPRNRWNNSTDQGAMHLIQRSNSLHAEIELAGAATIVRRQGDRILTSAQELIACSRYGEPQRHSDPLIGATVNELARRGAELALADPVGLCIAGLATHGWETPDGSAPLDYWQITRGTPDKALRAVYEVPLARGFTVGDIKINGRPIEFGSQIADFITIKLTALATRIDPNRVRRFDGCRGEGGAGLAAAGPAPVSEILAEHGARARR